MPFEEDLSVFMNPNDFGTSATYIPVTGDPVTVNGIFDNAYYSSGDAEVSVAGLQPHFQCAEADVPAFTVGDKLDVDGTEYEIHNPVPDGTGLIDFWLRG